jgi:hypothetical protein
MINQINIVVDKNSDILESYNNVSIEDIQKITNGYVNNMVFTCIDKIPQKIRNDVFENVLKKLSHGGTLTLKYVNPHNIAHRIKNNTLQAEQFSSIAHNIVSCWMEPDFLSLLSNYDGYKISKHYYDDIFCVSVIEKNK